MVHLSLVPGFIGYHTRYMYIYLMIVLGKIKILEPTTRETIVMVVLCSKALDHFGPLILCTYLAPIELRPIHQRSHTQVYMVMTKWRQ